MLDEQLRLYLELIINDEYKSWEPRTHEPLKTPMKFQAKKDAEKKRQIYGDKMAKRAKRQIAFSRLMHPTPKPEKGKYGQDVYATVAMQKAADAKKAKRTGVTSGERKMLLAAGLDLSQSLKDVMNEYDYTRERQTRDSLRKSGLNPSLMKTKSSARQRELKKMMKYDALQRSKLRQKEVRKRRAIASVEK